MSKPKIDPEWPIKLVGGGASINNTIPGTSGFAVCTFHNFKKESPYPAAMYLASTEAFKQFKLVS
jgi:hypothetical protein